MSRHAAPVPVGYRDYLMRQRVTVTEKLARVRPVTFPHVYQRPPCFDTLADWIAWRALALASGEKVAHLPCVDCSPPHQREMIAARRCSNPHRTPGG